MSGRRDSGATGACTSSSDDESEHQDGSDAEVPGKVQSAMRMRNGENDFEPSSSSNHVIQVKWTGCGTPSIIRYYCTSTDAFLLRVLTFFV